LRDWVVRYNAEGVDGLRDRERPGRPALLAPELEEELRQLIEAGPDVERDGVVEYRVKHIRDLALQHFGADYSRSGMQGRLHRIKLLRCLKPELWSTSSSVMISLGDKPGSGPRGAVPPGPNRDASHWGRNAWQKSSTSQKTSTIQHHRLRHSAMAAYLKKPFNHNPLIAQKPLIRVS
jgi:hypothetical protein